MENMMEVEKLQTSPRADENKEDKNMKDNHVFEDMDWDLHFNKVLSSGKTQCTAKSGPAINAVFRWKEEAEEVFLSGSYDNWSSKLPLSKTKSEFFIIKPLPQGTHEYKYLVNGEWKVHDEEPTITSELGGNVNVVTVKDTDTDVFVALANDDVRSAKMSKYNFKTGWTQELPIRGVGYGFLRTGPHLLPPQLSNTILNAETQAQCDPTILVQPTHVVLNHLYTLSIKDGVLVMASTYRFRKKYITTVIYKPI